MSDQGETERSAAKGIDRGKRADAASTGTFVLVFLLVVFGIAFLALWLHVGQWVAWPAIALGIIAGGIASQRKKIAVLNR